MLNERDVNRIINDFITSNDVSNISFNMVEEIKDTFFKLMRTERNKNLDDLDQESLVTYICHGAVRGESMKSIYNSLGDNSHMNYFDVFLDNGERDKIERALDAHGIPLSVLKGIKKNLDVDIEQDGVRIIQKMSTGTTSPVVDSFEIYQDGNLIYSFNREHEEWFDDYLKEYEWSQANYIEVKQEVIKSGKRKGQTVLRKYVGNANEYTASYYEEEITVKGKKRVVRRDPVTGRFTKSGRYDL